MVQFLSIIFFFISSIFVWVFKSSRFFVSLCISTQLMYLLLRHKGYVIDTMEHKCWLTCLSEKRERLAEGSDNMYTT